MGCMEPCKHPFVAVLVTIWALYHMVTSTAKCHRVNTNLSFISVHQLCDSPPVSYQISQNLGSGLKKKVVLLTHVAFLRIKEAKHEYTSRVYQAHVN